MVKYSIIIPVYNAEKYLHGSIGSVLAQKVSDFELILIDDGSQDGSSQICDTYASKDQRITVVHKKNEGPSAARNKGLTISRGKWIMFLDADDTISDNTLSYFEKTVGANSAIIQFEHRDVACTQLFKACSNPCDLSPNEAFQYLVDSKMSIGYIWNKLYRRDLIGDIRFNEQLKMSEDILFNSEVLLSMSSTEKIQCVREILYFHSLNPDSLVNSSQNYEKYPDMIRALECILNLKDRVNISGIEKSIYCAIVEKAETSITKIIVDKTNKNTELLKYFIKQIRKHYFTFCINSKQSLKHKLYVFILGTNMVFIKRTVLGRKSRKR